MKVLSVTEVARNFSAVLDIVQRDQEEIVLVRNRRHIARLIPEAPRQDALSVFGDLYRTLDDETAEVRKAGKDPDVRVNDLWFAAQAVQREFRLLTSNAKDFVDVPGLQLVVLKRHT